MLDGRGRVRITDFGLALSHDDASGRSETAGTPAYMAPEQIGKGEASVRSDIYSLGLVFYELFTGRLPYQATTPIEWPPAPLESSPRTPSSVVKDIDPVVESAILRCLQKDPALRPSSVRQVAAAFPGGDPLAAALAAGETPSPEMVAASGETEGLRPVVAWAVLTAVIVSVTAAILLSEHTKIYRRVPLEKPPEALAERARDILRSAGYSEPPMDMANGFYEGKDFLRYIAGTTNQRRVGITSRPGRSYFGIVAAPGRIAAQSSFFFSDAPALGSVGTDDPPLDVSGMTLVRLNPLGRLTQFVAVPPQVETPAGVAPSPDWAPLFSAAGLDPSKWPLAQPMWTPPVDSDARAAWTGSLAERPNIPMRIEAAAYRGNPVYFELIGPWTRPERMQPYQPTVGGRVFLVIFIFLFLSVLVGSALLTRRNLRLGRGDRRGAYRTAALVLWPGRWRGSLARTTSRISTNSRSSWSSWFGGVAIPVSRGFSTLLWSHMSAAAGPPRWSPGAACWQEAFWIHWGDATSLPVVSWRRFRPLFRDWRGLFSPGSAILCRNHLLAHNGSFWARGRSLLM